MEKGCDTCKHLNSMEGECEQGMADKYQIRDCDTSGCPMYERNPFYDELNRATPIGGN